MGQATPKTSIRCRKKLPNLGSAMEERLQLRHKFPLPPAEDLVDCFPDAWLDSLSDGGNARLQ